MLDVRALVYVSPISEQEIGPIIPIITLGSYADEDCTITGLFRIYRDSTGLIEYSSVLHPGPLTHGTQANFSAETAFNPGAVADDDYFVICQVTARSSSTGQVLTTQLGPFYFDTKAPPMGPVPAGHASTHEDGGMDEISVAGLSGVLADPQTPALHAGTHEDGQPDELNVAGLHGELADNQPPKPHDIESHTHTKFYFENDLMANASSTALGWPWQGAGLLSGTLSSGTSTAQHPGIQTLKSIATANSGYLYRTTSAAFLIAGGESSDYILSVITLAGTTIRAGWHNSLDSTAPVDGCYIHLDPVTGHITGRTMNGSVPSTTATSFLLVAGTWYKLRVRINANASLVTFTLLDVNGATLWTDSLNTNIPTTAGHEVGNAIIVSSTAGAASLVSLDYLNMEIDRVLIR